MSRQKKWKRIRRDKKLELQYMGIATKVHIHADAGKVSVWTKILNWLRGIFK